jgi:hypothetical protein
VVVWKLDRLGRLPGAYSFIPSTEGIQRRIDAADANGPPAQARSDEHRQGGWSWRG